MAKRKKADYQKDKRQHLTEIAFNYHLYRVTYKIIIFGESTTGIQIAPVHIFNNC